MKITGNRICHLCGTNYREENGHPADDCWGIIHQQITKAMANVRDLEYKLKEAQKRIDHEPKSITE
jgi:hypothetical protein